MAKKNTAKNRTPATAWKPGVSGNPAGRPVGSGTDEIVAFARRLSMKALRRLEKLVDDGATDERVLARIAAIALEASRIPREDGAPPPQTVRFEFVSDYTAPTADTETEVIPTHPAGNA